MWSPSLLERCLPTCGHRHEIMNTREADEFFEAFELANDQGTVSWGNISVSADAWIK